MIGLLEGIVRSKNDGNMIIMVHGVGYKVEATTMLLACAEGDSVTAYIYTHVREDAIKLFGFATGDELHVFEMLLSVSGVGPKGAMSIVSILGAAGVYQAVLYEDAKAFKGVPGIGMKNAEKIIIELKSKVKKEDVPKQAADAAIPYHTKEELESALLSLGYSPSEVRDVASKVQHSENTADMVKEALKLLKRTVL